MLTIWGRKNSINVQKVLWCCGELSLKYDRIDAGMEHGVNNTPEYRALNPNGLVPTINYDGFVLWEAPDNVSMAAVALAIGAGGAVSSFDTTVLISVEETINALRKAGQIRYRPPGA